MLSFLVWIGFSLRWKLVLLKKVNEGNINQPFYKTEAVYVLQTTTSA